MRHSTTVGWVGVLCLVPYWTARFLPEIADTFALSSFGKFVVFGVLLAGVLLTTIAAIRGSKWWFVVVVERCFSNGTLHPLFTSSAVTIAGTWECFVN